jgi:hypothetical protein
VPDHLKPLHFIGLRSHSGLHSVGRLALTAGPTGRARERTFRRRISPCVSE